MKKIITALTIGITGLASTAFAQTAMEQAIAQNICNGAEPLAAEYIDDGTRLKVTCPEGSVTPESAAAAGATPAALAGTGLTGTGAGAAILGIVLVAAVAGGGSSGTTTTTTTTGSGS